MRTVYDHQEALQQVTADRKANEGQKWESSHKIKRERWVEHIELNRLTPETLPNIQAGESNLPIDGNKPSKTKIKGAITTLKNGKAAGFGEKTAEAIKADTETSVNKFAQPHQEDL